MFTLNQTLIQPPFFKKRISDWSYIFKRLFPLLLVCFVTFSISTSGQTKDGYSDQCGCGTYRECKFKGPNLVCPGSSATFCIYKKIQKGYYYRWSVKGDGCYVPAPSDCKYSCITIRAKNSCWASYTVKLRIYDRYGKKVSECKKVVWVGDKEKPKVTKGAIASCFKTVEAARAAALAATRYYDNCTPKNKLSVSVSTPAYSTYCAAAITVTVTDKCYNSASVTYYTRIDNTLPVCYKGTIGSCYKTKADAEAAAIAATTAHDNCTADAYLVKTATTVGDCSATITVRVTDQCGNYCESVYYTRIDNTAPTCYKGTIGSCYKTKADAEAAALAATTAHDNCTADAYLVKSVTTVGDCSAIITVRVTDQCGNYCESAYYTRIDNTLPECYKGTIGSCYKTKADAEAAALAATTAHDNCTADAYLVKSVTTVGDCSATITVRVTDQCGNYCESVYYTRIDNTLPVCYKGTVGSCYKTKADAEAAALAATTAHDNCTADAYLVKSVTTVGDCSATITVRVTDQCGNYCESVYYTRIDNTPPVFYNCPDKKIVIKTCDNETICDALSYIYAVDNCDGRDVTYRYKIKEIYDDCDDCDYNDDESGYNDGKWDNNYKFNCFKKYIVIIKAIDKCGNVSKCKFKVIVKRGDDCHDTYAGGCSHGYWKKYDIHPYPSCAKPTDSYSTTFGVTLTPDLTLDQALDYRGGGSYGVVIRDGVAALLNSCANLKYPYAYTTSEVVAIVKGAFTSGNYDDAASKLSSANDDESGKIKCDFSNQNSTIASRSSATGKPELSNSDEKVITVSASPIPFEDRIRFVIKSKISGPATLDAYSLLGQKLSNIYKGNVHAGRTQTVDFNVPVYMRTNMVYRLRIADKEVAGKILKK